MLNLDTSSVDFWSAPSNQTPKKNASNLYPPVYSNFTAEYAIKVIKRRYETKKWTWSSKVRYAVTDLLNHLSFFEPSSYLIEGLTTSYVRRLAELYSL